MSRRSKLSRADREKRSAKKAIRAEGAGERIAKRNRRERWQKVPLAVRRRFAQSREIYEMATLFPILSEVVCERCGFAQPYRTDEDGDFPTNFEGITMCLSQKFLGIECKGDVAVTVDAFSGD